jgi:O-antigen/teichoic acid export membrane protein
MAGRSAAMSRLTRICIDQVRPLAAAERTLSHLFAVARSYSVYSLYGVPSALIDTLSGSLPLPIIVALYGVDLGGQFSLAYMALSLPAAIITRSVADAFHAQLSLSVKEPSRPRLLQLLLRTAGILAAIGTPPAMIAILWSKPICALVLGSRWTIAATSIPLLVPWLFAQLVVNPLTRLVYVCDGQQMKLIYDLTSLALPLGVFAWYRCHPATIESAVAALSIGNALCYLLYLALLAKISVRWITHAGGAVCAESPAPAEAL